VTFFALVEEFGLLRCFHALRHDFETHQLRHRYAAIAPMNIPDQFLFTNSNSAAVPIRWLPDRR
jgi:hypothetical protein